MITIEQIDEFRKRTNSSYEDARFFLERHQGNVLDAIIDFEKSKHHAKPANGPRQKIDFWQKAAELIQKGFDLRMTVDDAQEQTLFTVPVLLLILLLPGWPFVLFGCLGLVLLGYKLSFKDIKSTSVDVKKIFEHLGEQMRDTGRQHSASHAPGNKNPNKHGGPDATGFTGYKAPQGSSGAAGSRDPHGPMGTNGTRGPVGPKMSGQPVAPIAPTGPMNYVRTAADRPGAIVVSGKPDVQNARVACLSGNVVSVHQEPSSVENEEDGFAEYTVE